MKPDDLVLLLAECSASATPLLRGFSSQTIITCSCPNFRHFNRHTCAPPWTRLHPKPLLPFHHATHHPSHLNISATRTSTSTHTHGIQVASQLRTRSYQGKLLRIKRGNSTSSIQNRAMLHKTSYVPYRPTLRSKQSRPKYVQCYKNPKLQLSPLVV